ncbi:hypothetical protein C8Q80DRAFT_363484 [Daedaleopsis nitida]|nr:hypothetical protein C8Q80DRAFT_363484 [Daedaleopsis nitida]
MVVGKQSGKRTLAEVLENDMAAKRRRQEGAATAAAATPRMAATSRFFHPAQRSVSDPRGSRAWSRAVATSTSASTPTRASQPQPVAGSSGLSRREKENVPCGPAAASDADAAREAELDIDVDEDADADMGAADAVAQEEGYMSPTDSLAQQWDSPDISSPVRPGAGNGKGKGNGHGHGRAGYWDDDDDDDMDADVLSSSPVAPKHPRVHMRKLPALAVERVVTRALPLRPVLNTGARRGRPHRPLPNSHSHSHGGSNPDRRKSLGDERERGADGQGGPDLRDTFDDWDEITSGGEEFGSDEEGDRGLGFDEEDTAIGINGGIGIDDIDRVDADIDIDIGTGVHIDSAASSQFTPGPITPATDGGGGRCAGAVLVDEGKSEELELEYELALEIEEENETAAAAAARTATVADGWWTKWARASSGAGAGPGAGAGLVRGEKVGSNSGRDRQQQQPVQPGPLRRRETTVTPDGRQRPHRARALAAAHPYSAPQTSKRTGFAQEDLRVAGRRSLILTAAEDVKGAPKGGQATDATRPGSGGSDAARDEASAAGNLGSGSTVSTRNGLAQFRWTPACR